jgi:hypothetical protein
MKADWTSYSLLRNCVLKHIIEGKIEGGIEVTEENEEDLSSYWMTLKTRGYWKLKEEALYHTLRKTRLGRDYGSVERQTT